MFFVKILGPFKKCLFVFAFVFVFVVFYKKKSKNILQFQKIVVTLHDFSHVVGL